MAESSRRFNFDDFDEQIREALEEHGTPEPEPKRPGEIGGVLIKFSGILEEHSNLPDME